jgi:hypothetical protein
MAAHHANLEGSRLATRQSWTGSDGEHKTGLNVACFKAEKIGASAIGKNREKERRIENYRANQYKQQEPRQVIGKHLYAASSC